ncbi:UNVERIFIED_CONTAM: hypothetical protein GTU68_052734, partial [Idotea baltica]|nr:hypothetical protein [Idotea baltica]
DTTLIDFVSDQRAPTPTAAAELAVPVRLDLIAHMDGQGARLSRAVSQGVTRRRQRLADVARALPRPDGLLDSPRQRLDQVGDRLDSALIRSVQARRIKLADLSGSLRPSAAQARANRRRHDALGNLASRLRPNQLLTRVEQKSASYQTLIRRLSIAATTRTARLQSQVDGMDRLLATLGYESTLKRGYAVVRADDQVVTTREVAATSTSLEIQFSDGRLTVANGPSRKTAKPSEKPDQGSLF